MIGVSYFVHLCHSSSDHEQTITDQVVTPVGIVSSTQLSRPTYMSLILYRLWPASISSQRTTWRRPPPSPNVSDIRSFPNQFNGGSGQNRATVTLGRDRTDARSCFFKTADMPYSTVKKGSFTQRSTIGLSRCVVSYLAFSLTRTQSPMNE